MSKKQMRSSRARMAYRHSYVRQPSFKYQGMTRSEATRSIAKRFLDALLGR